MKVTTLIIGGGQAGLSTARYLKEMGQTDFIILDENQEVGHSWRERYDSLELDSFANYSYLEGFNFPNSGRWKPSKDDMAEYLSLFAKHFDLEPIFNTTVTEIRKKDNLFIVLTKDGKVYQAANVVVATGPFHRPFIPPLRKEIEEEHIYQIHSSEYKNPSQLKEGSVMVIGGGNSGAEIAEEVAESGKKVFFSFKRKLKTIGNTELNQWLAYKAGLAHLPKKTLLGKLAIWYTKHKAVGLNLKSIFHNKNMTIVGELLAIENKEMIFKNKVIPYEEVDNIIWATGYSDDVSLIHVDKFEKGKIARGVSNIPGLYFLNLRWHYSKSSSHLAGVSRDAKYIAKKIISRKEKRS